VKFPEPVHKAVRDHKYPLLFATVSGAHLYGFPSANSDFDLRGVHILPLDAVLGLQIDEETIESSRIEDGVELDLVTHDAKKFFSLMLKRNGYVLEQLLSPLVLQGGETHEELKEIASRCITRHHSHHYLGFAKSQWKLFAKETPPHVKPLLYTYRVLLTGLFLMRTGRIEANLVILNEDFKLPFLADLIARKTGGTEHQTLNDADMNFHEKEYNRLVERLEQARDESTLPESPSAGKELDDLLKRLRLESNRTSV